ncbi:hypothetical protein ALQ84_00885, partial [Pseudomonas caricapapayae]
AEGRKADLSRTPIPLTPQSRCVTQSVTNCVPTRSVGTIVINFRAASLTQLL